MSKLNTHRDETQERPRGRQKGSKNVRRELPATIHPEQRLTIRDMSELSGKSVSFFNTNLSLARTGRKHTPMPPITKVGRNILCRATDFFAWLQGEEPAAATAA